MVVVEKELLLVVDVVLTLEEEDEEEEIMLDEQHNLVERMDEELLSLTVVDVVREELNVVIGVAN